MLGPLPVASTTGPSADPVVDRIIGTQASAASEALELLSSGHEPLQTNLTLC